MLSLTVVAWVGGVIGIPTQTGGNGMLIWQFPSRLLQRAWPNARGRGVIGEEFQSDFSQESSMKLDPRQQIAMSLDPRQGCEIGSRLEPGNEGGQK